MRKYIESDVESDSAWTMSSGRESFSRAPSTSRTGRTSVLDYPSVTKHRSIVAGERSARWGTPQQTSPQFERYRSAAVGGTPLQATHLTHSHSHSQLDRLSNISSSPSHSPSYHPSHHSYREMQVDSEDERIPSVTPVSLTQMTVNLTGSVGYREGGEAISHCSASVLNDKERANDTRDQTIQNLRIMLSRVIKENEQLHSKQEAGLSANEAASYQEEISKLEAQLEQEKLAHERTRLRFDRDKQSVEQDLSARFQKEIAEQEHQLEEFNNVLALQRKLLSTKDEEIRNLSQLAAAHKQQIALLHYFLQGHLQPDVDDILGINRNSTRDTIYNEIQNIPLDDTVDKRLHALGQRLEVEPHNDTIDFGGFDEVPAEHPPKKDFRYHDGPGVDVSAYSSTASPHQSLTSGNHLSSSQTSPSNLVSQQYAKMVHQGRHSKHPQQYQPQPEQPKHTHNSRSPASTSNPSPRDSIGRGGGERFQGRRSQTPDPHLYDPDYRSTTPASMSSSVSKQRHARPAVRSRTTDRDRSASSIATDATDYSTKLKVLRRELERVKYERQERMEKDGTGRV